MWIYVIVAVIIFILLKELIRLPTVGKYEERYVFITGCDTGFGSMLAKRLDSLGFNVFASCYTERGADELRKVSSAKLKTLSLDVTKTESIIKAKEYVEKHLPPNKGLWALVNNAGILANIAPTEMQTKADYEACFAVNLLGPIDVTRIFQPLVRQEKGRIVNMVSMAGRMALSFVPYTVSKFGMEAFSDCLRREVFCQGITVHIIEPSFFKTEIVNFENEYRMMQRSYSKTNQDVQIYYGKSYAQRAKALLDGLLEESMSPKTYLVVDAYTHAITAMFPRARYLVGWDKHFWWLMWNLPEWLSDRMLRKKFAVPDGAL